MQNKFKDLRNELAKSDQADEIFILRRLRNIGRVAPEILEVTLTTTTNPIAGFRLVAKKAPSKGMAD